MAPQDHATLDDTYGAALIGTLVNAILYGATTSQTYTYYSSYPKDGGFNKLIVGALWILDTVHTAFTCQAMYYYLISNYLRPSKLGRSHWAILLSVLLNRVIAFIAQAYFTHVTFKLCPLRFRWWLASVIGVFVVAHAGFGIAFVALCFAWDRDYGRIKEMNKYAATPAVISGVIAEFTIAGSLCLFLKARDTGFKGTRRIIGLIIVYAVNRCLLSSVFLTVEVAMMESKPATFYYMAIEFIVGKLYVASILATLNSRPTESITPRIPSSRSNAHTGEARLTWAAESNHYRSSGPKDETDPYVLKEYTLPDTFARMQGAPSSHDDISIKPSGSHTLVD